jgi:hypothetical protein
MRNLLYIGSSPAEESCASVGRAGYAGQARKECETYINQLRRQFGQEPEKARLTIKSNPHDFGTYLEVVCYYDTNDQAATDYAFKCEDEAWPNWDAKSRKFLGLDNEDEESESEDE